MKFWNRLRWFGLAVFFLVLLGVWLTESPQGDRDPGGELVPAPKFPTNP
jgi:hypothetical protein